MVRNKRLIGILVAAGLILLIPLVAMQVTDEVHWTILDFVAGGILLLATGLLLELVIRKVKKISHRMVICAAILSALILIWAELSVGIFGTPFGGD